ncbi:MAG: class I SAM-dependent methyltransferase [Rhodobacteraceae bacterium]|nr:class I SAM-dependent methyltransferase [Paracoccaceae bacterium]
MQADTNLYEGAAGQRRVQLYEKADPAALLSQLTERLAPQSCVLDIGAGSGRDAAWLATQNHNVVAVEPSSTMRGEARKLHSRHAIKWMSDELPGLDHTGRLGITFDAVLLSAVWMHVAPQDRARSLRKIVSVLKPGGLILISLKHEAQSLEGPQPDRSQITEIQRMALNLGAHLIDEQQNDDALGRPGIKWTRLLLRLADDATGALPLLRHVILNDRKSTTYKLALLRAVARAADGAQGMAEQRGDDRVVVPLGLIALNWLRLFLPLIKQKLPQSPRNCGTNGLSFVKKDWVTLEEFGNHELRIGAVYSGYRAAAVHTCLRDAAQTIVTMPAHHMTYPGNQEPILPTEKFTSKRRPEFITIDRNYLSSFGEMEIPLHLWQALVRYDNWVEPALIAEWTRIMDNYASRQNRSLDPREVARAMRWNEPERTTRQARETAQRLLENRQLFCVWTGRRLSSNQFDIDHCLPWAVWPCGDLWNLMPAHRMVNNRKRDKLPSAKAMEAGMERILDWWQRAWQRDEVTQRQFILEAQASLPALERETSIENLFEAVEFRRIAIRSDQQAEEWTPPGGN